MRSSKLTKLVELTSDHRSSLRSLKKRHAMPTRESMSERTISQ